MSHRHLFKNIGGGCAIDPVSKTACDDDYKCDCGLSFRVYTSMTGHRYLPEQFEEKEMSEIKAKEQEEINNSVKENNPE